MLRIWYSELRYLDTMKTMCSTINRMLENMRKNIRVEVSYWSWKYHYRETVHDCIMYECVSKSPLDIFKEMVERLNLRVPMRI